jgi:hypothetical protein
MRALAAIAVVVALSAGAIADPDPGDPRFRAALLRDDAGDRTGAIADLVAIADELPASAWADDALATAARLLERAGDPVRAAALLARLADTYPSSRSAAWARSHADELTRTTGDARWRPVAAEHDAVIVAVGRAGDPAPHLARLGALVVANPDYPRATSARLWLGDRWSQQGDWDRAHGWYREALVRAAAPVERRLAQLGIAAALTGLDEFSAADATLDALAADPDVDPIALARARDAVDRARFRYRGRIAAWIALVLVVAAGVIALRRSTGSMRGVARALARPPAEAWFVVPVAVIVSAVSATGNALVGSAVRWIAVGGVIVAWGSGAILSAAPALPRWRFAVHIVAIVAAAGAVVYLAVSRDRLLDLLAETWKHGHELR